MRGGAGPGVGLEAWLRWFARLFVVVCAEGMCSTPLLLLMPFFCFCFFALALQKWQLGFLSVSFGLEFALTVHACGYFSP